MPAKEGVRFHSVLVDLETCNVFQGGHPHFAVLIFATLFHYQGLIRMSRPFQVS